MPAQQRSQRLGSILPLLQAPLAEGDDRPAQRFVQIAVIGGVGERLRRGQLEPRVVDDVVELGDEVDRVEARRVADEKQRDREADRDPYEVLFQDFRP